MEKYILFRMGTIHIHAVEVIASTRHDAERAILEENGCVCDVRLTKDGFKADGNIPGSDMITSERLERNGWIWKSY